MIVEGLEVTVRCGRDEPQALAALLACDLSTDQLRRLAAALVAEAERRGASDRSTRSIRLNTQRHRLPGICDLPKG